MPTLMHLTCATGGTPSQSGRNASCSTRQLIDEVGRLDESAVAQVRQQAWPDLRDADELHDFANDNCITEKIVALPYVDSIAQDWSNY